MKAIGKTTKWKDGEDSFMIQENSLTKEIGAKVSFMDSEKSTMTTQNLFKMALLIQTLITFQNSGNTTIECSLKTLRMEKAR